MGTQEAIKTVRDFDEWQTERHSQDKPDDESKYEVLLERFHREALAWVRLGSHENIIYAMAVFEWGGKPYLVMEYADGGDLAAQISRGPLSVPLALNFSLQFCVGMQYAVRTAGIVHRDIKPSNVLLKDKRIVKISDFGLARAFVNQAEIVPSVPSRLRTVL